MIFFFDDRGSFGGSLAKFYDSKFKLHRENGPALVDKWRNDSLGATETSKEEWYNHGVPLKKIRYEPYPSTDKEEELYENGILVKKIEHYSNETVVITHCDSKNGQIKVMGKESPSVVKYCLGVPVWGKYYFWNVDGNETTSFEILYPNPEYPTPENLVE